MSILRKLSDETLTEGTLALASGDVSASQRFAAALYSEGRARRDGLKTGKALLLRAQTDIFSSRMHNACAHARRAIELFDARTQPLLRLHALATHSYALASLGETDQARASASECHSLAVQLGHADFEALGHNYLGVADFWSGHHERGSHAFQKAIELTEQASAPEAAVQPLSNWCFSELLSMQRESLGRARDEYLHRTPEHALALLDRLHELVPQGKHTSLSQPERIVFAALADAMGAFAHLYANDHRASRHFAGRMRKHIATLPRGSWMRTLPWWYDAESARRLGKLEVSRVLGKRMRTEAIARGHRPMSELAKPYLRKA